MLISYKTQTVSYIKTGFGCTGVRGQYQYSTSKAYMIQRGVPTGECIIVLAIGSPEPGWALSSSAATTYCSC